MKKMRIELREKVRGDIDKELKEIESITEPNSIYPKILKLPKQTKQKNKRGTYNISTKTFETYAEENFQ